MWTDRNSSRSHNHDGNHARLQDVLSARLERLHACAADMIDGLIAAAKEVQAAG
jgi:hypothetical protein